MYINHDLYNNEFIHVLKRHKLMWIILTVYTYYTIKNCYPITLFTIYIYDIICSNYMAQNFKFKYILSWRTTN